MTWSTRLILCVIALFLSCGSADAQGLTVTKNYWFDEVNGKVLPIPADLPASCFGSVGGWPFVGFAFGGIYLPAVPYPIFADVTLFGQVCGNDPYNYFVAYCISNFQRVCSPRGKFLIKTKSAVLGVRG